LFKAFLIALFFKYNFLKILLKTYRLLLLFCFVFIFLLGCNKNLGNKPIFTTTDSVSYYINQSKKTSFSKKHKLLIKAYLLNKNKNDSIKNKNLLKIASQTYLINDSVLFKKVNGKALKLSKKLKDSADISGAYWNFGDFYGKKEIMDSAYYHYHKAYNYYKAINNDYNTANMLYDMAFIQGRLNNPAESEILTYKAIAIYKALKKFSDLYDCYNLLGLIYIDMDDYNKALKANNKALIYLKKIKQKGTLYQGTLNNIGLVYEKEGKHKKAVTYFKQALKTNSLKIKDPFFYAILIDNLAYNKFKSGDSTRVIKQLYAALKIRDSLKSVLGAVISELHLAEFYYTYKNTDKALVCAKEALTIATKTSNNTAKLSALKLLSKIDTTKATKYLNAYITLNDSLIKVERKLRNKFTRIQFQTNEYIKETHLLTQQRFWIILASFVVVLLIASLYFTKKQQARNKELIFEQQQQKANEQIYKLMIKQQTKLQEGQLKERHRIAEELHDGILGKLFGTRMQFGFLNLKGDDNSLQKFNANVDELQKIEKEIRGISHALKNELLTSQSNFMVILKTLINNQSKISGFKYKFTSDKSINWENINDKLKINLYRIIQEALQNIVKHAKATKIKIDFNLKNNRLVLTIQDDGIGFDVKKAKKGIGLKNIRSRVQKLNGKLVINTAVGKGAVLLISVNIT